MRAGIMLALCCALAARADDGIGFQISAEGAETGIAVYPGAKALKSDKDSQALSMAFWGGSKDFRLSLAKYWSADDADRIAEFYRTDLARFGRVVDCSAEPDDTICGDASREDGVIELRAGKKKDQRIVAISPKTGGCKIVLLHLRTRGL